MLRYQPDALRRHLVQANTDQGEVTQGWRAMQVTAQRTGSTHVHLSVYHLQLGKPGAPHDCAEQSCQVHAGMHDTDVECELLELPTCRQRCRHQPRFTERLAAQRQRLQKRDGRHGRQQGHIDVGIVVSHRYETAQRWHFGQRSGDSSTAIAAHISTTKAKIREA